MTAAAGSSTSGTPDGATHEVVFTIPVGEAGLQYRALGNEASTPTDDTSSIDESRADPGSRPWGPTALTIGPNHTFFIADTVDNRVLAYNTEGVLITPIALDDEVVGVGDVKVTDQAMWVLDHAAEVPQLLRFALTPAPDAAGDAGAPFTIDTNVAERIPIISSNPTDAEDTLDISAGVTGLVVDDGGVLLEYGNGTHFFRPQRSRADADANRLPAFDQVPGYTFNGQLYTMNPTSPTADPAGEDSPTAHVMVGDQRIPIPGTNSVLGLRLLGVNTDQSFYVVVEEVSDGSTIQVDQTVRHYAPDGQPLGVARVPLRARETYIPHSLTLGADDRVYMLMTRQDVVEVQRLVFTTADLPPLPAPPEPVNPVAQESEQESSGTGTDDVTAEGDCQSRDAMVKLGFKYRDNKVMLRDVNINGNCPGRGRPRYIDKGPGEYGSVAYDWGGFDTVEGYNAAMADGFQAGDIPQSRNDPPTACSKGVDCSGFVSRCWGLTAKEGTATIGRLCTTIKRSQLRPGDILNLSGAHVTLFHHLDGQEVWAFEATTWMKRDRVIFRPHGWDYYDGYSALRFKRVCPD